MIKSVRTVVNYLTWPARWAGRLWDRFHRYSVMHLEDLPDRLKHRTLYVVGESTCPLHASMACPLKRCSTTLNMNLAPDELPMWSLSETAEGAPTLSPSVWRRTECGCHFFLRNGRIEWR